MIPQWCWSGYPDSIYFLQAWVSPITRIQESDFSFDINLNGSTNLSFLPFRKMQTVNLTQLEPSSEGSFLPRYEFWCWKWIWWCAMESFGLKTCPSARNRISFGNLVKIWGGCYAISGQDKTGTFGVRLMLPTRWIPRPCTFGKYCLMFLSL